MALTKWKEINVSWTPWGAKHFLCTVLFNLQKPPCVLYIISLADKSFQESRFKLKKWLTKGTIKIVGLKPRAQLRFLVRSSFDFTVDSSVTSLSLKVKNKSWILLPPASYIYCLLLTRYIILLEKPWRKKKIQSGRGWIQRVQET